MKMKVKIDENIDNLAAKYLVESLGTVPKDNEALFTRVRVKKILNPEFEIKNDEAYGEPVLVLKTGEPEFKEKDSLIEKFYINEWKKSYEKAIADIVTIRFSEGVYGN